MALLWEDQSWLKQIQIQGCQVSKMWKNWAHHHWSSHHRKSQLKAKWINAEKTDDIEDVPL